MISVLIEENRAELEAYGTLQLVLDAFAIGGNGVKMPMKAYWLNAEQMMILAMQSRTAKGVAFRKTLVELVKAVRDGRLVQRDRVSPLLAETPRTTDPDAYDVQRTTSYQGLILSEFGHALHVHEASLAMALGMSPEALEAHLATRPFIDALGKRPEAPDGGGRFLHANHVDFAVSGLPATDGLRTIQDLMRARDRGDVFIRHRTLVWAYKTERGDDAARKLLEALLRKSQTAPWNAIDMLVDADGVLRARHTHLALYHGLREATVREAIADHRGALEAKEPILDRIENLHGNTVMGHYLTAGQSETLAEAMHFPVKKSREPFETYIACEGQICADVDKLEDERDAVQRKRDAEDSANGNSRPPLPTLRSRIAMRLFRRES